MDNAIQNEDSEKLIIGSKAHANVVCGQCQAEIAGKDAYSYKDNNNNELFLCESCRTDVEKYFKAETKNPNIIMALILGSISGVVAGVIWYYLSILTGYQIGYVAIGVGFIIGWAVVIGSGNKRGMGLQLMSAVITLVTLFVSEYFITLHYILQYMLKLPGYSGELFFPSPFEPSMLESIISPMGLLIWGIGIYFAYSIPKSRSI